MPSITHAYVPHHMHTERLAQEEPLDGRGPRGRKEAAGGPSSSSISVVKSTPAPNLFFEGGKWCPASQKVWPCPAGVDARRLFACGLAVCKDSLARGILLEYVHPSLTPFPHLAPSSLPNTATMLRTNVLQGEVQRSWVWISPVGAKHVIDLWHDTVTGVRSVAVGLEEVPGSMGSSPFFTTEPHHINFTVGHEHARGMVIIEKAGLFSFRYTCVVNGRPLRATLQGLADENEERFYVSVLATANAYSTKEKAVTWYELTVTRRSDDARTVVHRRYREFQCLFEQVHAAFKGHHLRSSLPELPGRQLKLLVDHTDTAFVEERRLLLETAVGKLLSVPHVCAMVPVQVFLGFLDRLKEHSVVFTQRDLGMSITRTVVPEESIVVTRVKEVGQGGQQTRVMVGDTVSKVNGEPVGKYGGFDGVTFQISKGLRPIVIHFLEAVDKNPGHDFLPPGDPIEIPPVHEQLRQRQASLPSSPFLPPPPPPTTPSFPPPPASPPALLPPPYPWKQRHNLQQQRQ